MGIELLSEDYCWIVAALMFVLIMSITMPAVPGLTGPREKKEDSFPSIPYGSIPPMPKCKPAKRCQFISGQFIAVDKIEPGDMIFLDAKLRIARKRTCRECGCTEADCSQCIEATGKPCHWVEPDLCSRCADEIKAEASH